MKRVNEPPQERQQMTSDEITTNKGITTEKGIGKVVYK